MTPVEIFMIIINILTTIEIAFIILWTIEHKQNQKDLEESSLEEDEDTQEYIREVIKEEFKPLSSKLTDIHVAIDDINLGVNALVNHEQITIDESDDLDKLINE